MSEVDSGLSDLRTVAQYQFGSGAGSALFPVEEPLDVDRTRTGRASQVHAETGRIVSYGVDGRFTLGLEGGRRLLAAFEPPACRVTVGDESVPFVSDGKNAFAKFVRAVDPRVRPGDEVAVVTPDDGLLAVGRAELSATAMTDFDTGVAVHVRDGTAD